MFFLDKNDRTLISGINVSWKVRGIIPLSKVRGTRPPVSPLTEPLLAEHFHVTADRRVNDARLYEPITSKDILNLVQNDPKLPQEDLKDSAKVPTKYVNLDCSAKRPVDTPKYQKYLILTKTTRNYPFLPHEKLPSV